MSDSNMVINISGDSREIEKALNNIVKSIKGVEKQAKKTTTASSKAFGSLTKSVGSLKGALIALGGVAVLKKGFSFAIESTVSMERTMNKLKFAVDDSNKTFKEISQQANRLGIDVMGSVDAFSSFAAATKGSAIEGQATKDVFTGVASAVATFGLSADDTRGALKALEQMMSKGTVSSEELKGQFGERIPGSFRIAAESMGVTQKELMKMLDTGKLLSEDFLPKFAKSLQENFGDSAKRNANTLNAALNDIRFTMSTVGAEVGQGLTPSIKELSTIIKDNKDTLITLGKSLVFVAESATTLVRGIQNVGGAWADLANDIEGISTEVSRAGDIIDLKNTKLKSLTDAYLRSGLSAKQAAEEIKVFAQAGAIASSSGDLTGFIKIVNTELSTLNKKAPKSVDAVKKIKKALTLDKKTESDLVKQLQFFEDRNLTSTERVGNQYKELYARIVQQRGDAAPELEQLEVAYTDFLSQENEKRTAKFNDKNNSILNATRAFKIEQEKINNQQENGSVIQSGSSSFDQKIAATQAFFEQKTIIEDEQFALDTEKRASAFENDLISIDLNEQQKVELRRTFQESEAEQKQAHENRLIEISKNSKKAQSELDKQKFSAMLGGTSKALGMVAGLMNSHSRKAFELGKAAAIGKAVVDTASAAMGAYTSLVGIPVVGPVIAPIAAAAAVAVGVQNVSKISSAKFGGGSASGATGTGTSIPTGGGSSSITPPNPTQATQQAASINFTVQALDPSAIDETVLQKIGDKLAPVLQSSFDRGQGFAVQ